MALRSTFYGLEIAASGLYVSQKGLDVTGHNIANVDTVGYSRQRLITTAYDPNAAVMKFKPVDGALIGSGAKVKILDQIRDEFLDRQYRTEDNKRAEWETRTKSLTYVEALFEGADQAALESNLAGLFAAFNTYQQQEANDKAQREATLSLANALIENFHQIYNQLEAIQKSENDAINVMVSEINNITTGIAQINRQIYAFEAMGDQYANDLRDKRNVLLDELSTYVNINYHEDNTGKFHVYLGGTGNNYLDDDKGTHVDDNYVNANNGIEIVSHVYQTSLECVETPMFPEGRKWQIVVNTASNIDVTSPNAFPILDRPLVPTIKDIGLYYSERAGRWEVGGKPTEITISRDYTTLNDTMTAPDDIIMSDGKLVKAGTIIPVSLLYPPTDWTTSADGTTLTNKSTGATETIAALPGYQKAGYVIPANTKAVLRLDLDGKEVKLGDEGWDRWDKYVEGFVSLYSASYDNTALGDLDNEQRYDADGNPLDLEYLNPVLGNPNGAGTQYVLDRLLGQPIESAYDINGAREGNGLMYGYGILTGGILKAHLDVRDNQGGNPAGTDLLGVPYFMERLNELARALVQSVNEVHQEGWTHPNTGTVSTTGTNMFATFFDDGDEDVSGEFFEVMPYMGEWNGDDAPPFMKITGDADLTKDGGWTLKTAQTFGVEVQLAAGSEIVVAKGLILRDSDGNVLYDNSKGSEAFVYKDGETFTDKDGNDVTVDTNGLKLHFGTQYGAGSLLKEGSQIYYPRDPTSGKTMFVDSMGSYRTFTINDVNAKNISLTKNLTDSRNGSYQLAMSGNEFLNGEFTHIGQIVIDSDDPEHEDTKQEGNNLIARALYELGLRKSLMLETGQKDINGRAITITIGNLSDFADLIQQRIAQTLHDAKVSTENQAVQTLAVENQRISIMGVSLDEEMTNLIRYQHAYNGNARVINVMDEILDKLINGTGRVGL
ncbi:MAG: flagellar hook-associated protein FlgK [Oscillospiraceae bacterium]|jgi:flagellar hook-associated protein FlgK|nr:flagellar hook-associated protein FlgK [Oscillospiraceae bacterium]